MKKEKTAILLDRCMRASFYALIFFLPISIALVSTCSGFAIFFFLVKRILFAIDHKLKWHKAVMAVFCPPDNFLNKPLGVFIAAVAISVVFSQDHSLSILAFFGKILRGVFLFSSFLEAFKAQGGLNNFIFIWFTSAFLVSMSGLHQYFFGYDFLRNTALSSGRVSSSMRHANDLGAYIIVIIPLLFIFLNNWKSVRSQLAQDRKELGDNSNFLFIFCIITYAVLVFCLGVTYSRAAWVSFGIVILFIGFYKKESLPLVFILVIGFMWAFSPMMEQARHVSLLTDDYKAVPAGQTAPVKLVEYKSIIDYVYLNLGNGRWGFWKEAINIIHDYPWWGCGLNTYSQMGAKYRINWGGYPHNSYLQMTAELGILGLGTFLWMLFVLFKQALLQIRRMPSGYLRIVSIGAAGGLAAYFIQSFFDTTFYSVQLSVLMWLLMAVLAAALRMNQLTKTQR